MIRTQIQLPDELYDAAKRIAAEREMTLAEVMRRGLEHMARIYPARPEMASEWHLPEAHDLGQFRAPVTDWRDLANDARAAGE